MTEATLGFKIDSSQAGSATLDLEKLVTAAGKTEKAVESLEGAARGLGGALGVAGKGAGEAKKPLDDLGRSFGAQDEHVRAFRLELDRLTAKFQPMARASKNYEAAVSEINRAHQLGVISAQQMQKALDGERQAYERLKTSAMGANEAVKAANQNRSGGAQRFNAANATAQFQDIGVTAAMGMNPLMIGLQQGTQLASVVSSMERPVAGLAGAFMSLVSPVSLVTIGLTAGIAALIQYVSAWGSGGDQISEKLKVQNELIANVAERWGDATPLLKAYADELTRVAEANDRIAAGDAAAEQQFTPVVDVLGTINKEYTAAVRNLRGGGDETAASVKAITTSFADLQTKIMAGKATTGDLQAAQEALASALEQYGIPSLQKLQEVFGDLTPKIEEAIKKAKEFREEAKGSVYPDLGSLPSLFSENGKLYSDDDFVPQGDLPRPQRRPLIELEGLPGEQKQESKDEDVYKRAIEAAKENVQQLQLQAKSAGETGLAADTLRFKLDLLQRAFKDGKDPVAEQTAEIDALTASYKAAAEAATDARFAADMAFQGRQARRTTREQQIGSTLRGYGYSDDLNSEPAQRIGQQLDWSESKDMFKGFFSSFEAAAWENGGKIGDTLGKAALNSLQKATGKLWDNVFDRLATGLADVLMGARGGNTGSGVGGVIGSAAAALGGRASNDNRAPVIPVTRSALPDVGASTDIASYIAKAAAARGIDPVTALKVAKSEGGVNSWNLQSSYVKNGVQEPSFGPFQLYKGGGLGNDFQRKTGMDPALASSGPAGVDFALDHASKNGWGAWYGAAKVGVGKWDGIGGSGASDAVSKLGEAAGAATKGLDTFGGGLGKLGQSLSTSFFPAAPSAPSGGGGGGLFSWLGGLFGGGADLSKYKGGIGLYADGTNYAPGGMAVVGERGPELVDLPQGSKVFNTNKSAQMMAGAGNDNGGGVAGIRVFVDQDGNWQAKVESIAARTSQRSNQAGLADQQEQMRRGGFGDMQRRYANQKG